MARTVNSLGDRHVKANKQEEEIKTTIVVPMTINVIQANVDDWTIFFVGLEMSFLAKMIIALQGNVQNVQQINIVHLKNIENYAHVINVLFLPIINATMKVTVQAIPNVVGIVANYAQAILVFL